MLVLASCSAPHDPLPLPLPPLHTYILNPCSAPAAAYLGTDARNFLKALLQKDATKRLGYGPTGSADVMKHPFFKTIKWDKLMNKEIVSPFKPAIRTIDSVENFDKIWTDLAPLDSPAGTPDTTNFGSHFEGFSWAAPNFLANNGAIPA